VESLQHSGQLEVVSARIDFPFFINNFIVDRTQLLRVYLNTYNKYYLYLQYIYLNLNNFLRWINADRPALVADVTTHSFKLVGTGGVDGRGGVRRNRPHSNR